MSSDYEDFLDAQDELRDQDERDGWPDDEQDLDQDEPFIEEGLPDCDEDGEPLIDGAGFADPGGRSALRAATSWNPRNLPCPTCGRENVLTPADRARGYQCDRCADQAERGF